MTLRQIINELEQIADDFVLFASRQDEWRLDGHAALVLRTDLDAIGVGPEELTYFLEVPIAKEVLNVRKNWGQAVELSEQERIAAVLYYAENDAYLPVGFEL